MGLPRELRTLARALDLGSKPGVPVPALPCECHVIAMGLPCVRHVFAM